MKSGSLGLFNLVSELPNVVKTPSEYEDNVVRVLRGEAEKLQDWQGEDEREVRGGRSEATSRQRNS